MKSRPIFWDTPAGLEALWYVLAIVSVAVFLFGVGRPLLRYRRGNREGLPPRRELPGRIWVATKTLCSHASIGRRDAYVSWAHRGIFYGWMALLGGTIIVAVTHDLIEPIFGTNLYSGDFYLACKAILNLLGTALIAGLLAMMIRRGVRRPRRLDYARPDRPDGEDRERRRYRVGDWVFVIALLLIALTGFVLQGVRIAMEHPGYDLFQFGGWVAAQPFERASQSTLAAWRHGLWWFHGLLALVFVASIPYTKATHMLTSFVSLVLKDPAAGKRLPTIPEERAEEPAGYGALADFSALHLLEIDACTKCGRCHEVCPATTTGRPLSPRDVVLELHERANGEPLRQASIGGVLGSLLSPPSTWEQPVIGGDGVSADTAWSCMQCNACVEVCPVGIQQAPIINQLRRRLLEDGEVDNGLQATLQTIQRSGNSLGQRRAARGHWTKELEFEVKDARTEPVDVLWFVGDYASFDPRSQEVTRTLARLLDRAGIDFGILYDGECNAGNDVRRVGEEGLFEMLAEHNIEQISNCDFNRIVTTDPHSLNTLRNEYPELGGEWPVLHHTELLLELVETGRLALDPLPGPRVTYHDPCYLGRHNGVYDAPRRLLELIGCELVEMPRCRDSSFCCGAGGGQIWISEQLGDERPSENRIREALELASIDLFVVACPKDVTMYEDAIKTTGSGDRIQLREVTELLAETTAAGPCVADG